MKKILLLLVVISGSLFAQKNYYDDEIKRKIRFYSLLNDNQYELTENQKQFDIKYYGINLAIDPGKYYTEGYLTLKAISTNELAKIELNFTNSLITDSVIYKNKKTDFVHANNFLTINFDSPAAYEDFIEIDIYYHGTPASSGFGSFGISTWEGSKIIWTLSEPFGARDWWPCKDHPSDKADSVNINVTVPKELVVASNGLLRKVIENNDTKTYYWHESYPISTYLISITAYPYHTYSDYYKYSDTDSMEITYFTLYPENNSRYEHQKKLPNMIKILSNLFGEYPFIKEKYGHAEFPWGGGMEHQTCSSMGSFNEALIMHELAHQWWGNMITCDDFHNLWLNEGFATYVTALYHEIVYGKERFLSMMNDAKFFGGGTIYVHDLSNIAAIFSNDLRYNKASWILHMLRHVAGNDTFFAILKEYYNSSHKFGTINTKSFQNICEKVSGIKLDWFFDQWIFGEYYPQYTFSYKSDNYFDSTHVELTINQKQDGKYLFKMPIDIYISTSKSDTVVTIFDSLWTQKFYFTVSGQVENIELDKNEWILKESEYIPSASYIEIQNTPVKYELLQNYPNPFNPSTTIKFSLPKKEHTVLKVFDVMGKEIITLIDNELNQGTHSVLFDLKALSVELSSGLYFYLLKAGSYIETKKMLLLK